MVLGDAPLHHHRWRVIKFQIAMHLPEAIAQQCRAMRQIGMARVLPLRPVANVVLADHAIRSSHPNERAEIDEPAFEPHRAIERAMDQPAMHPQRMPQAHRYCRRGEKQGKRAPAKIQRAADEGCKRHARYPQRLDRRPMNFAGDGIGIIAVEHARRPQRALRLRQRLVDGIALGNRVRQL